MNPFLKTYATDRADEELIHGAQEGDRKCLEELLLKHQPYVYNIAWKMVRDPNDAEDLTQEALIKITVNIGKFKFNSTFRTWAYRIVVNHFLSARKRSWESKINSFDFLAKGLDSLPDVEMTELEQKEHQDLIREMNVSCMSGMLLCLNREQRIIYIIGEMFDGDHNIGSEIMNISKDNYRAKLKKARKDLYNYMNNKCGLVNKNNPCRCHKKVTAAVEGGAIDAKNLLFNRKEFASFKHYISQDAEDAFEFVNEKYRELYQETPFKKTFDKKLFIQKILEDANVKRTFNL